MLDGKIARRSLLKGALASLVAIPVVGIGTAHADGKLPPVDVNDPMAKGLKFVNSGGANACKNCSLYKAIDDKVGACTIFAGKSVPATGWCVSFNAKTTK